MLQPEIIAVLLDVTAVTDIIGNRIYLGAVPDVHEKPYLVLTVSDGKALQTQDGPVDLAEAIVELAAVAATYKGAHDLHKVAKAALVAAEDTATLPGLEPISGPRDAPNIDNSASIFAVVELWSIAHQEA